MSRRTLVLGGFGAGLGIAVSALLRSCVAGGGRGPSKFVEPLASPSGQGRGWRTPAAGAFSREPLVHDGIVLVFYYGGAIVALNERSGETIWKVDTGETATSVLVIEDCLFVAGGRTWDPGRMTLLRIADGARVWSHETSSAPTEAVQLSSEHIAVGHGDGSIRVIRTVDGSTVWTHSPAVAPSDDSFGVTRLLAEGDRLIAVTDLGPPVYESFTLALVQALDSAVGTVYWRRHFSGELVTWAHLAADGTLYVLRNGEHAFDADDRRWLPDDIVALDSATGTDRWRHTSRELGDPLVVDGLIIVATADTADDQGQLRALDATSGATVWTFRPDPGESALPETTYLTSADGVLCIWGNEQTFFLDVTTGQRLWSIGRRLYMPTMVSGVVYGSWWSHVDDRDWLGRWRVRDGVEGDTILRASMIQYLVGTETSLLVCTHEYLHCLPLAQLGM